jgi:hypothetical protein
VDILETVEARWFIDDVGSDVARIAKAWFAGVAPQAPREDRYLITGRDDLGFKARIERGRPSRVEAKYLLESLGPRQLHARASGVVERWRKLSLELADPALEKDGVWMGVVKRRRLRVLRDGDGGCGVELTEIECEHAGARSQALTIGLEAFGPSSALLGVLVRAGQTAFAASDLRLEVERSESYPRWLTRIVERR